MFFIYFCFRQTNSFLYYVSNPYFSAFYPALVRLNKPDYFPLQSISRIFTKNSLYKNRQCHSSLDCHYSPSPTYGWNNLILPESNYQVFSQKFQHCQRKFRFAIFRTNPQLSHANCCNHHYYRFGPIKKENFG